MSLDGQYVPFVTPGTPKQKSIQMTEEEIRNFRIPQEILLDLGMAEPGVVQDRITYTEPNKPNYKNNKQDYIRNLF